MVEDKIVGISAEEWQWTSGLLKLWGGWILWRILDKDRYDV